MKHLKYLWYVIRHKWYVLVACSWHGLFWRGLVHDLSKFRPSEWFPYANYFYGDGKDRFVSDGYYKVGFTGRVAFDAAWLHHQRRNKHHWQYWHLVQDDDETKCIQMPTRYWKEMVCDWIGAGKAQGNKMPVKEWYKAHRDKLKLHWVTRMRVEEFVWKNS